MTLSLPPNTTLRREVVSSDCARVRALVAATNMFSSDEIGIAVELVEERLRRGPASGYEFIILESHESLLGYSCFGMIPCTVHSFDLYWIVVDPARQGQGLGKLLMQLTEDAVLLAGGTSMYVETSGQAAYASTQQFYKRCGYELAAELPDFYAPGDSKQIYCRRLPRTLTQQLPMARDAESAP